MNYYEARLGGSGMPRVNIGTFEQRDATLKGEGFIWWERFWLSQHHITGPAIEQVRADRANAWKRFQMEAFDMGWTDEKGTLKLSATNEWRSRIRDQYKRNGWYFADGALCPFRMIDDQQHPGNITPQPKLKKRRDHIHIKDAVKQKRKKKLSEMKGYGLRLPNL